MEPVTGARAPLASLELFAGAGGLALGLERAGFKAQQLVELDPRAIETLRANGTRDGAVGREWPVLAADVRASTFTEFEGIDLLAAGPPCQPFSIGGLRKGKHDDRDLVPEAIRAVREAKPKAFVIENVRGLTFPKIRPYLDYCLAQLRNPSALCRDDDEPAHWRLLSSIPKAQHEYRVQWRLVNAADYGLPQQRVRLLIVGVLRDLPAWDFPTPTYSRTALLSALEADAYWNAHGVNGPVRENALAGARKTKAALQTDGPSDGERWRTVRDALAELGVPGPDVKDPHHQIVDGARLYKKHRGSLLDWPAKTVKAGVHGTPGGEHVVLLDDGTHRYFTVRECAVLQGFPASYRLPALRSVALRQIGNAVPVPLAETIGRSLRAVLEPAQEEQGGN